MAYHQYDDFRHDRLASPDRQVRLLTIVPPTDGRRASYSLQTYLLHSRRTPNFYAVSYEWGAPDRTHDILIDGKRFAVRSNLRRFLRRIGNAHEAFIRPVWIDAICIDQNNIVEKNAQVSIMGEIFSEAELVLTWLGKNDDEDGTLTETTPKLKKWQSSRAWAAFLDRVHNSFDNRTRTHRGQPPALFTLEPPFDAMWTCIRRLCEQTYWTRLWIVQEMVKAKRVLLMWGHEEIDWDVLAIVFTTIQLGYHTGSQSQYDTDPWAMIKRSVPYKIWQHFKDHQVHQDQQRFILENMDTYKASKCSRPHDKAYALRGISNDAALLPIDYDTSLPDLYIALMGLLSDSKYCVKYSHLILEAIQLDEWSLTSSGGIPTSLKTHFITCEAEQVGHVIFVKPVAIQEPAEMVELEVLEMLAHSKLPLDPNNATRLQQWVARAHKAFQEKYRNDINQVAFFALSNGQIGISKSVILVGDSVCSFPSHLGDNTKVFLRIPSRDDYSEDGQSIRSGYESPQLSSPTQSSFLSDISMETITRVWLLPAFKPTSLSSVRSSRQTSASKIPVQISFDTLVSLQNSLNFEVFSSESATSSATTSPVFRQARLNIPLSTSPVNDPAGNFIDEALRRTTSNPNPPAYTDRYNPRAQSGQTNVDSLTRQMQNLSHNNHNLR